MPLIGKIGPNSFTSPVSLKHQHNQEINHPRNFSKGVGLRKLIIKSPGAYLKNDQKFPLSTDSKGNLRKRPEFDLDQMKSEITNIKTELSLLKIDISTNTKNLKEIDINMITSSPQKTKVESDLRSISPINQPFNKFSQTIGLSSKKKDIEKLGSVSPSKSFVSGLDTSIGYKLGYYERYQQIFPNPIQIISTDLINKENSGVNASANTSFTKIDAIRTHSISNMNIRPTVNNYTYQKNY